MSAVVTERDFSAELRSIEMRLTQAQQEQGRLQGEKTAISRNRNEIVSACSALGVEPKRESIEKEIESSTAKLAAELSSIDAALRAAQPS